MDTERELRRAIYPVQKRADARFYAAMDALVPPTAEELEDRNPLLKAMKQMGRTAKAVAELLVPRIGASVAREEPAQRQFDGGRVERGEVPRDEGVGVASWVPGWSDGAGGGAGVAAGAVGRSAVLADAATGVDRPVGHGEWRAEQ